MPDLSRRSFLGAAGAAAVGTVSPVSESAAQSPGNGQAGHAPAPAPASAPAAATGWLFLDPQERRIVEAACSRLIPADALGPGALEADVPRYLDRQLAGAWGAGDRLYRSGPWRQGERTQGYQLPFTPAELFRTALRGIREDLARAGRAPFERLPAAEQDDYLRALEAGRVAFDGVPSATFFDMLLAATIEGFFADPAYGGNRDMAGWRLVGFPGAHANWYEQVDRHGLAVDRRPMSLAEDAGGHVHVAPVPSPARRGGR